MGVGLSSNNKTRPGDVQEYDWLEHRRTVSNSNTVCSHQLYGLTAECVTLCSIPETVKKCLKVDCPVVMVKIRLNSIQLYKESSSQLKKPVIDWNDLNIKRQVPEVLPSTIGGELVRVFAMLGRGNPKQSLIMLTGVCRRRKILKWIPWEMSGNRATQEDLMYLHNLVTGGKSTKCKCFEAIFAEEINETSPCEDHYTQSMEPSALPHQESRNVSFHDRTNEGSNNSEEDIDDHAYPKSVRNRKPTPFQDDLHDSGTGKDLDEADDELSSLPSEKPDPCHTNDVNRRGQNSNKKSPFKGKVTGSKLLDNRRLNSPAKDSRGSCNVHRPLSPVDVCCHHAKTIRNECICGSDPERYSHDRILTYALLNDKHSGILVRETKTEEITPLSRPHANSCVIQRSSTYRVYKYPLKKSRSLPVMQINSEDIAKHF